MPSRAARRRELNFSASGSREILAAAAAVRLANRTIRNDINRATRATLNPVWRDEVTRRARTALDRKVLARGARILAGNPPVAVAASSNRPLKGGFHPSSQFYAVEFGANRDRVTTYQRQGVEVTRHTARQLPARTKGGRVVFPALKQTAPRAVALWVQLVVKKFAEAYEKGGVQ